MDNSNRPLTAKQQQFALEYCVDFNGSQAAIRAGYKSERAADAAYKLLKDKRILKLVNRARKCRVEALEFRINQESAMQRARALCSIADMFRIDPDGTIRFKDAQELQDNSMRRGTQLKVGSDGTVLGVKLKNPTTSLVKMMKIADVIMTDDLLDL